MAAAVQHKANDLAFCAICAIQRIQSMEHARENANLNFLEQNARGHVSQTYHTITIMKFVTPCALQEVNATRATAMGHVRTDFANVIRTGTITVGTNAYKHVRVRQYATVMEHANYTVIHPAVYVNEAGMVKTVTSHVPEC